MARSGDGIGELLLLKDTQNPEKKNEFRDLKHSEWSCGVLER